MFLKNCAVIFCLVCFIGANITPKPTIRTIEEYEEVYGELSDSDVQKDDYYDEDQDAKTNNVEDDATQVIDQKFVSKSEKFINNIGDVVILPCNVSNPKADVVRKWAKENMMIFQDSFNTQDKKNLKYFPNGSIEVKIENVNDFGNYSCTLLLSSKMTPSLVHEVINRGPQINSLRTANNKVEYSPDETLQLICEVEGHPKPRVKWYKDNKRVGPEGSTLTIPSLKVTDGGVYRCLADNEGKPAHKHIEIHVKHAPIVQVQEYLVNSEHKNSAEFVCLTDAYPEATAEWKKDGQVLYHNESKIKVTHENAYSKNVLIVRDLTESDFGTYSCVAKNSLGSDTKNITLVRIPVVKTFDKTSSDTTKDVVLQWKVASKQPISVHELQYRKKGENTWKTITPAVNAGDNDVYLIKHTLKNLEPGIYETRARSKNVHGWSDFSEIMPFEGTNKHGSHHQKQKHNKKEQRVRTQDSVLNAPAQHTSDEHVGESRSASQSLKPGLSILVFTILPIFLFGRRERTLC
ncbi:hypothetical protein GWI33_008354 [Rhynchophorus ferrugineus]|uniref:Ig-like domain-containing protein n=1 Tax=Rhynchophorus ferrugineus TaxID=354439 RepID=A0A834IS56_RHYFE|nr:hypothetical protein GWI33_008354 [Rhynchophorus ferrugineus]